MPNTERDERALVERARAHVVYEVATNGETQQLINDLCAAITSLSQEVERLTKERDEARADYGRSVFKSNKLIGEIQLLADPTAVHVSMLRGTIAKPTWENIRHLYPSEVEAAERRLAEVRAETIEACAKIADEYDGEGMEGGMDAHLGDAYTTRKDIASAMLSTLSVGEGK